LNTNCLSLSEEFQLRMLYSIVSFTQIVPITKLNDFTHDDLKLFTSLFFQALWAVIFWANACKNNSLCVKHTTRCTRGLWPKTAQQTQCNMKIYLCCQRHNMKCHITLQFRLKCRKWSSKGRDKWKIGIDLWNFRATLRF